MKVYGDLLSGNCYKVKLLLHMLDIPHEWIHIDVTKAETHSDEFKAINPNAKIPALVLDQGEVLCESNAILNYLADGTDYLPSKKMQRAQVLQWQFFEQYSHEPYVAVARYIKLYLGLPHDRMEEFESKKIGAAKALKVMEQHLLDHRFFVAEMFTIADISLYAYTHVAQDGDIDLKAYPAITAWMQRIEAKLKHKTMLDFIKLQKKQENNKKRLEQNLTAEHSDTKVAKMTDISSRSMHNYSLKDLAGYTLNLSDYENQIVLIVNVASECGLTPQYRGLQNLYKRFASQGFAVIGVPCNQFGAQEPGSELEIKRFCDLHYKTTFPMTSKIEVNGDDQHPLYEYLCGTEAKFPGDITWNFEKFLIGKNGQVIKRFGPKIEPESDEVIQAIESLL